MRPIKFTIYKDQSDNFRWRLKSSNGKIVADSGESYVSRSNARRAAEDVQRGAPGADIEDEY